MFFSKGLFFAIGMTAASGAAASPLAWECSVDYVKPGGLVSEWFAFNYDPEKSEASVLDGIISYYKKDFIPVQKIKDGGDKVVFSWMFRVKTTSQAPTLTYDASIDRKTGRFNVHAVPLGYDNSENVRGTCKEVPGPLVMK